MTVSTSARVTVPVSTAWRKAANPASTAAREERGICASRADREADGGIAGRARKPASIKRWSMTVRRQNKGQRLAFPYPRLCQRFEQRARVPKIRRGKPFRIGAVDALEHGPSFGPTPLPPPQSGEARRGPELP